MLKPIKQINGIVNDGLLNVSNEICCLFLISPICDPKYTYSHVHGIIPSVVLIVFTLSHA